MTERNRKVKIVVGVIGLLLLGGAIAIAVFSLFGPKKETKVAQQEVVSAPSAEPAESKGKFYTDQQIQEMIAQAVARRLAELDSIREAEARQDSLAKEAREKAKQDSLAKVYLVQVPELKKEILGLKKRLATLEKRNKRNKRNKRLAELIRLEKRQPESGMKPVVVQPKPMKMKVKAETYVSQPASYIQDGYTYVRADALRGVPPFYLIGPSTNWKPDKRYEFKDAGNGYYRTRGVWREFQVIDSTGENWGDVGRFGNWIGEGKLDPVNPYKAAGVYMDPAKNHYIFKPVEK